MRNTLMQQQTDSIRASIQKEEIIQLIRMQRIRHQPQQLSFPHSSPLHSNIKSVHPSRHSSFHIRERYKRRRKAEGIPMSDPFENEMQEKMNYFSVRHHYQQIIKQTGDLRVTQALREELSPARPQRYIPRSQTPQCCNFFQRVLNKQHKTRQFMQIKRGTELLRVDSCQVRRSKP